MTAHGLLAETQKLGGEAETLLAAGVTPTEVARKLGIGRVSVDRAMKERKIKRVASIAPAS